MAEPGKISIQIMNYTVNPPVSARALQYYSVMLLVFPSSLLGAYCFLQSSTPTWITVHAEEEAKSMLRRAIETLAIAVSACPRASEW